MVIFMIEVRLSIDSSTIYLLPNLSFVTMSFLSTTQNKLFQSLFTNYRKLILIIYHTDTAVKIITSEAG